MTKDDAIKRIEYRIDTASRLAGSGVDGKAFEDLELAVEALKKCQRYEEIGTVEEFRQSKEKESNENASYTQKTSYNKFIKELLRTIDKEKNEFISDIKDGPYLKGNVNIAVHAKNIIKEVAKKYKDSLVSIETLEQVMWERDMAICQLHELGYGLGEKIREEDKKEKRDYEG